MLVLPVWSHTGHRVFFGDDEVRSAGAVLGNTSATNKGGGSRPAGYNNSASDRYGRGFAFDSVDLGTLGKVSTTLYPSVKLA